MSETKLPHPLCVGDLLGDRYALEGVIGSGGMGVIVAATDTRTSRPVAVKLLRSEPDDHDRHERLSREASALASLRGEHVAELLDVGAQPSGAPFLVMERLVGQSLAELIAAAGHLPQERAVDLVLMACEALSRAHALGIVHRDIKPSNLFVVRSKDGAPNLKVLDFGLAKLKGSSDRALTGSSARLGTTLYMSPEQLTSPRDVTARTDIWSLGVVLYETLTGLRPFDGEHDAAVAYATVHSEPPPLSDARAGLPRELDTVMARCLAKDPSARHATVGDLALALAPFASPAMQPRARALAERMASIPRGESTEDAERADDARASHPPAATLGAVTSRVTPAPPQERRARGGVGRWQVASALLIAAIGGIAIGRWSSGETRSSSASSLVEPAAAASSPASDVSEVHPRRAADPALATQPPLSSVEGSASTATKIAASNTRPVRTSTSSSAPSARASASSAAPSASQRSGCPDPYCAR